MVDAERLVDRRYSKPPILEVVVAIHFENELELKSMRAFARKVRARFPHEENLLNIELKFGTALADSTKQTTPQQIGLRVTNQDKNKLVVMNKTQFALGNLAPYISWGCSRRRA